MILLPFLLATAVVAAPSAGYPFNSQLPPVARWGHGYSYTLPRDTCTGDGEITYSAEKLPSWLSFDGATFSGTPEGGNEDQTVYFQLNCKDSTGQTASSESKLIISSAQPPKVNPDNTVVQQLAKFGPTDGSNGLVVKPNQHWSVAFDKDTFIKTDRDIEGYYGIMRNHTPLPIWMSFTPADTNIFAGQSPAINSPIAPAQVFSVQYMASDYAGFSAVSQTFSLVVGAHQLTTEQSSISVDAKRGEKLDSQLPLDKVMLDGAPIGGEVGSIQLNINEWLKVDNSGKLSGTPDDKATSGPISATVYDKFGDAVVIVINVNIDGTGSSSSTSGSSASSITSAPATSSASASSTEKASSTVTSSTASSTSAHPIFSTQIPNVNATQGQWFSFTISQDMFRLNKRELVKRVATVSASYNPPSTGDFIHFNPSNMTFNGQIPDDFKGADVTVTAVDGDKSDSMTFRINGIDKKDALATTASSTSTSTSSTTSSASATATSASSSETSSENKTSTNKAVAIGCGVGIPLAAIAIALLFFCCWRRKKQSNSGHDDFEKANISAPMPSDQGQQNLEDMYLAPEHTRGLTPTASPNGGGSGGVMLEKAKAVDEDWDTPKRLSAMNFFKVDQYDSDDGSVYSSERTHVDREVEEEAAPGMPSLDSEYYNNAESAAAAAAATIPAPATAAAHTVQPRKSWRQTIDSTRRWQDRQSMASLATVSTDELFSVRMVEDEESQRQSTADSDYMNPTQSMILTPSQSVIDNDSPNYRNIGTSSTGQHSSHHSIGSLSSEDEPFSASQFVAGAPLSRPNSSFKVSSNLASVTEESPNLKNLTPQMEVATPNTFTNSPPPIPAVNHNRPSPSSLRSQLEAPKHQFDFETKREYRTPEAEWKGDSSDLVPGWNTQDDDDTSSDDDRYHRYHDSMSEPHFEHELNHTPKLVNFTNSGRASSSDSPGTPSREIENSQSVSAELAFI